MNHPDHVAQLLRERSAWLEHSDRGSRDHDAPDWQDAAAALVGASPLAFAAFQFRHSEQPLAPHLLAHPIEVARSELGD